MKNEKTELSAEQITAGGDMSKSAEQLASEHILDMEINDDAAQAEQQQEQAQTSENQNNALYSVLTIVPMGFDMFGLKNTAAVWSDNVCKGISQTALPVLQKYEFGRKFLGYIEQGGGIEEFALIIALAPVAMATTAAYKLDMAELRKNEKGVKDAGAENDTSNQ